MSEVRVGGARAAVTTSGEHELEITPRSPLPKGREIAVVVRYAGVPSSKEAYGFTSWLRTPDGGVAAGEPEAAWWWFPGNDHPLDKATYDVSVLVPDGSQAIFNGTLRSTSSRAGWTRYNWHSDKPQATYLATLAVGRFEVTTGRTENGIPIVNAYGKDIGDSYGAARQRRTHGRGRGLADGVLRAVSVQRARRVRAEHPPGRVRAGDPDPAVLQPASVRERVERVRRRP